MFWNLTIGDWLVLWLFIVSANLLAIGICELLDVVLARWEEYRESKRWRSYL